jgi:diguanylate cyclase (GGDEF)-like protein
MSHLAHHDFLTDLPNRVLLRDRLTQAIASAQRHGNSLALLFLDVDHFKQINDCLGHAVGDQILQSIAQRLVSSVRASDTVSRQGGDEFVILLPEITGARDVSLSADKLLYALARPHRIDGQDLLVTASIGIGVYPMTRWTRRPPVLRAGHGRSRDAHERRRPETTWLGSESGQRVSVKSMVSSSVDPWHVPPGCRYRPRATLLGNS